MRLNRYAARALAAAAFLAVLATGVGCETTGSTPQPTQKEAATKQWNDARASVLASLAADQYKTGNFDKCRVTINEAMHLDPENASLYVLSAKIAIEQNQLELGERELAAARKLDPKNAEADYLGGVIYQRWQKPEDAYQFYCAACEKAPAELAYLLAKAEMLVAMDRHDEALALLQEKAQYFEHSGVIRDAAGELLVQMGRYADAADMLQQASILASDDNGIREHLAKAYYLNRQYREALEQLQRLVALPEYESRVDLYLMIGESQLQLRHATDARAAFETASRLKPDDVQCWLGVAKSAVAVNDDRRADLALNRAQAVEPASSEVLLMVGYLRLRESRYPEAMAAFRTASTLDRTDPVSVCMVGYVLEKTGRSQEALQYYARALRIHPNDELATKLMAAADTK